MKLVPLFLLIAEASASSLKILGVKCLRKNKANIAFEDLEFYSKKTPRIASLPFQIKPNHTGNEFSRKINPKAKQISSPSDLSWVEKSMKYWTNRNSWSHQQGPDGVGNLNIEYDFSYSESYEYVRMSAFSKFRHRNRAGISNDTDDFYTKWYNLFATTHIIDQSCSYRHFRFGVDSYFFFHFIYHYDFYRDPEIGYARVGTVFYYWDKLFYLIPKFIFVREITNIDDNESYIIYSDSKMVFGNSKRALFLDEDIYSRKKDIPIEK